MDEQNRKQPWYKPWRRIEQKATSTGQPSTLLSPGSSKPSRSRSPFRRLRNSTPSTLSATLPTVPTAASPSLLIQAGPGVSKNAANVSNTPGGTTIVPPKTGLSPWEMAIEIANKILLEHGLTLPCNTSGQPASKIIESTIEDLQIAIGGVNTGNKAAAIKRLHDILKTLDKYAKIVDTAIQHSPEITALVWAGLRATLQVSLNHIETMESLEVAIAIIAEKMAVCEFFASVYEETQHSGITLSSPAVTSRLQQILDLALPEFYAAILVFAVKTRQYFDPSTSKMTKLKYLLKPFAIEFKPFIDDISEKEKRVCECADMATMNMIKTTSGKLAQIDSLLHDLQSKLMPLAKLDVMMDMHVKNSNTIQKISDRQEDQKVQQLLAMLTSLESPKRHQDVKSDRVDGTGAWLLQDERFLLWRDSFTRDGPDRILCCYGDPGAGKTVISSIVIDNLVSEFPQRDNIGIAFIYCDYRDQGSQTLGNMLGSILQQFLSVTSTVPKEVTEILERTQKQRKRVEIQDVSHMLNLTFTKFHRCFICIDALDELEPQVRLSLLNTFKDFSTVRIFLTARPIVQEHVNRRLETQETIKITPHPNDILSYLNHHITIDSDINPGIMNDKLKEEILNTITTKSKGMFLLPKLHIRMVLEYRTIAKRRSALGMLPEDLKDAFTVMVDRILKSRAYNDLGSRTLVLLHLAYRPLKLEEFRHALSVESGQMELDEDNIPLRTTFLECCLGLVIVDEETMTVRFVHYTLEEHFKLHGSTFFPDRYTTVAKICLTYLNFGGLRHHCATRDDLKKQMARYPFLEYAAWFWGYYAKQQDDNFVIQLALNLLRQESMPSCSIQASYGGVLSGHVFFRTTPHTVSLTRLHLAAYFGLEKYMVELVDSVHYWDPREENQVTPLSIAARNGNEGMVRLLLEQVNVDADSRDKNCRSPLSHAAAKGYETIVRMLLKRDNVDADSKDKDGKSPLLYAAWKGHEAIVSLLLERDNVYADSKDKHGRSPLSYAAMEGHEAIVGRLLERDDVDADSKGRYGTPLSYAAVRGHETIVRLLLEHDNVDADSKDKEGKSPLLFAAWMGKEAIVRLLLERDNVDADLKDKGGRSPLSYAAGQGHEAIVRLLLERGNVDADSKDNDGRSPLSYATGAGQEAIVRLFLERDNVDADSRDKRGRSPLSYATGTTPTGHVPIVRLFLERDNVDADSKDKNGKSPLSYAAMRGHVAIVRLLLERGNVDADSRDKDGRSPLSYAALGGHETIVSLLLQRGNVDAGSKGEDGRSPLSYAAEMGYEVIVRLLLERDNVDADSKDEDGRSPLSSAAWEGHVPIVRLLLEKDNVDADSKDKYGRSSLSYAADGGHETIVRLLLERDNVDADSKDTYGRSPLSYAAERGHEVIARLLLGQDNVDADSKDEGGRSPLSYADAEGHQSVVELLRQHLGQMPVP